jgi:predicted permease
MFILRLVGFLLLITIGASLATYLLTRNRRYLIFAWQVLKYGMVMAIIALAFLLFDRLVMVV